MNLHQCCSSRQCHTFIINYILFACKAFFSLLLLLSSLDCAITLKMKQIIIKKNLIQICNKQQVLWSFPFRIPCTALCRVSHSRELLCISLWTTEIFLYFQSDWVLASTLFYMHIQKAELNKIKQNEKKNRRKKIVQWKTRTNNVTQTEKENQSKFSVFSCVCECCVELRLLRVFFIQSSK